jgi:CDP-diacylglycerol--glycerol-3-phosphate 3-phosphatidyltransferase
MSSEDPRSDRIRDMPPPRRTQSVIGPAFRSIFAWPFRWALAMLMKAHVRPWHLTVLSLITNVVVAALLLTGRFLVPGLLLLLGGLFDIFDGSVARLRGEESRAGAFLDSMLDRVSDAVVFGALYWELRDQGLGLEASLALVSLVVSLGVSHLRAEAESLGLAMTEGAFQRLERVVALILGLTIPGALIWALVVLTVLGSVTVLQRIYHGLTRLARDGVEAAT